MTSGLLSISRVQVHQLLEEVNSSFSEATIVKNVKGTTRVLYPLLCDYNGIFSEFPKKTTQSYVYDSVLRIFNTLRPTGTNLLCTENKLLDFNCQICTAVE